MIRPRRSDPVRGFLRGAGKKPGSRRVTLDMKRSEVSTFLADRLSDLYVRWREECYAVQDSYERWVNSQSDDRQAAFAAYSAALDREERASAVYAELIRRVGPMRVDPV